MILDVNSPLSGGSLDRTNPSSTYNSVYYEQVFGVIEAFKNFPNTLGFFAGNEVINEQSVYEAPAYVRVCSPLSHWYCVIEFLVNHLSGRRA